MLYIVGIGLNNQNSITKAGLEAVKKCDYIYLESYTSKLQCDIKELEKLYNKEIIKADRDLVEKQAEDTILKHAKEKNTAFLVIGDPFSATTHTDIYLRAKEKGIEVKIFNNVSILTAIGVTGLELYKFGRTVSIPFDENAISFYNFFQKNQEIGLHTLFLLDLNPLKNKFLTINIALERLLKLGLKEDQLCIGVAALGSNNPEIKTMPAKKLKDHKFTKYPQSLIIPGKLHFVEEEAIEQYR